MKSLKEMSIAELEADAAKHMRQAEFGLLMSMIFMAIAVVCFTVAFVLAAFK